MSLDGKVIVITGSTRGIGRAIAESCASAGVSVVVCGRNRKTAEDAADALAAFGHETLGLECDVRLSEHVENLLKSTVEKFGRLDVWVNNAGIPQGIIPVDEMTSEEAAEIVRVNIEGVLYGSQVAIRYFKKHGGILLNMTGKGSDGKANPYTAVYAMSKAAVTSLTKGLADECRGYPISVHLISPGMVATDFYRNIRVGKGMEARAAALHSVLEAIGVPPEVTGELVVKIAGQMPGETTGRIYNAFSGRRMVTGIAKMMRMRIAGKLP